MDDNLTSASTSDAIASDIANTSLSTNAEVRQLLQALQHMRGGNFSVRLPGDWPDLWGKVADLFNEIVGSNEQMAQQLERVGQVVGQEGKTKQRVKMGSAAGAWHGMELSINSLIDDLLWPTAEVTRTIRAVAQGDLMQTMWLDVDGRPLEGEFLRSANIVNSMIKQLSVFTSEVTRVAREVGTDGKLGGQAKVTEVTGVWKELTESVNLMASNLTAQVRNIADVTIAVANGDLSKKITVDVRGEILQLKEAINTMVDQLRSFAAEVTRVAREVGTEGRLGGQAVVPGVAGTWKDLTDNVNLLAANLTTQVRNIAEVTTAVARGDLSRKITVDVKGEILELKNTINTMVDQLNAFAGEVTRVAREVGTEGKLGGQAQVTGVAGTWKDLTDNVNSMASNLTGQVRNIAEVATAIAGGDLSKKITVTVSGEILQLKETINTMVDQLNGFASEVTRVAREVGTEGILGGQADVRGVAGTWKDLTDSVNSMASNLTTQVRNIAEVSTAIANGDLSKKIDVDVRGEVLELKQTINTMVDQLNRFAGEVTRVAREVGTEGRLGGQANVPGVAGTWKDLTDNVNLLAANLTTQVRNIADVTTAVARGDLSKKITVDVKGEILELKATINTMVDQLNGFAGEVTRVAREVGTEGKLGGQAQVPGVAGTWKDLTDNVNFMASNLTAQVRNIAEVATAIAGGDLSKKITVDVRGEILLLKETLNTMVEQLRSFAAEVTRVAREVGTEGRLGGQAVVPGVVAGTWKDLTDSVNSMAGNLTGQVRNIAEVTTAVARGDLSRKITVDVKGEILELKNTINTMVDQLNAFASEVTRVAREVGTEGKLGGQAQVPGVAGTWKDLTDTVNVMAANLTEQVRGIVKVVTAVAEGDLKQKLTVKSKGEVAALAETINDMTDTLAIFADQVTTVAREVGVEGRLGGQASVPGAAGTWKALTGNVNLLADNLTNQVRAIAEVTTAVTKGDLTRSIQVDARGEVAELKDYINTMIGNLRLTTDRNTEQDWLKTNLARLTGLLQGQRDLATVGRKLLSELVPLIGGHQGVIYQMSPDEPPRLTLLGSYANISDQGYPATIALGEGFIGQCAVERRRILITEVPQTAVRIGPALLDAVPRSIVVLPVNFEDELKAVIAVASLHEFDSAHLNFLEQLTASIGIVLNSIEATMQTEGLLKQSQQLARELQDQQTELQTTNEQLEQKAQQLAERNVEVEAKNQEIERARRALEEKASELALTSKYKSEFLANMSHELRTPLNSILILGQQLGDNVDGNLTDKQVEFARTIHGAGSDLLTLISDILDLSKIESGTVSVDAEDLVLTKLLETVARPFRLEADRRGLDFDLSIDASIGKKITTDSKRLQQILKNLLSNAFKFTEHGGVRLTATEAPSGWNADHPTLSKADGVVAFEVSDTGIGILPEKQRIVFEAFQQADAGTSRKYGGTGLGLAISRELAALLGGDIQLRSAPGSGSTFTLYLPKTFAAQPAFAAKTARPTQGATQLLIQNAGLIVDDVEDDRDIVQAGDLVLLIVEDDQRYASVLADLARSAEFKVLIAHRGVDALLLANEHNPSAITLDVYLPDMLGWNILSQLKQNVATRHIPVQMITLDEDRQHGLSTGAFAFLPKPTTSDGLQTAFEKIKAFIAPRKKQLLLIEDNPAEQLSVRELLAHGDINVDAVTTGAEALAYLETHACDCIVLDLKLPDMSGFDVLAELSKNASLSDIPVIVFTGRELSPEEDAKLHALARSVVVKGVESPERLLDETSLFLHRVITEMPPEKQRMIEHLHRSDDDLIGKTLLIVDDDPRNIFAMSSVLERRGMKVVTASTGKEAINRLQSTSEIAIVLMDIMMPEMDGYETMQAIRAQGNWLRLPIIALTAKAMKGDREKCLEAGASDYLAKPVNTEQLLTALRMWLHR